MNHAPVTNDETWPPAPAVLPNTVTGECGPPSWRDHLTTAPPEIVLFAVFAIAVSVGQFWLTFMGPKMWREAVAPYTGGTGLMPYLFCVIFACRIIFAGDRDLKTRYGITALLLLGGVFGAGAYLMRPRVNFHNPYLTFSPWQPVWTVALPLAWAALLHLAPALRAHRPHV